MPDRSPRNRRSVDAPRRRPKHAPPLHQALDGSEQPIPRLGPDASQGEAERFARELKRLDPRRLEKAYDDLLAALEGIVHYRALQSHERRAIIGRLAEKYGIHATLGRQEPTPELRLPSAITPTELWSERSERKENPVAFVRRVYAPWLGKGMTRADLRRLDLPLYRAFSAWIRRHPEDPVSELPSLSEAIDRKIERLAAEFTSDDLRKLGLALQNRLRRKRDFD